MGNVRVRFAPSPTGYLHIGGARTALFNWLWARKNEGSFILRIEDTDLKRSREEALGSILDSLRWLGLDWDEGPEKGGPAGPYFQSERIELYRQHAERLLASGRAYHCYCSPEELTERREAMRREGKAPRYDRRCRDLTPEERRALESAGRRSALRLKVPDTGTTVVRDVIRGQVSFDNSSMDDIVIMKSDGMPTYNFACVVDDATMGITHVIRGEEHLSNTPKQLQIYEALDLRPPVFAHVPMILAPDRSKLSKRHGATAVEEFREDGYLPEALVNYLALLGWSPEGGEEIIGRAQMIEQFDLDRISKTAAIYDIKKLTWINGHYLREADLEVVVDLMLPRLKRRGLADESQRGYLRDVIVAVRTRVRTLTELEDAVSYYFTDDFPYEEKGSRKYLLKDGVADLLREAAQCLAAVPDDHFTVEGTERAYRQLIADLGITGGKLIHPTRMALTGRTVGPGIFDVISLLGKRRVLERLNKAIDWVEAQREEP